MFDEQTRDRVYECAKEIRALIDELGFRLWEGCTVRVAPAVAAPAFCTVEIEGVWDENVMWRGTPTPLNVGDEVIVWESPLTKRREIWGAGGAGGAVVPGVAWGQTVIVAVSGGDYTSVATACAAVAAEPPTAATPWTILVMSGVFNEASFAVPTYTTLIGRGESTVIDVGGGYIAANSHSSMMDVVIESTCASYGFFYYQNNTTDVVLFNVKAAVAPGGGASNYIFYFGGTSTAELFHCVAEATNTGPETDGFYVGGGSDVLLWDCKADDPTNIDNGLELANSGCTVTSKYCEFGGADDDVVTGAASTWNHYACQYDEGNSTINGTDNLLPGDGGGAGVLEVQVFS